MRRLQRKQKMADAEAMYFDGAELLLEHRQFELVCPLMQTMLKWFVTMQRQLTLRTAGP